MKSRDERIAEFTAMGLQQIEIAESMGLNVNTVRLRQQVLGLRPTNDGPEFTDAVLRLRLQGMTQEKVARALGRSQQVVRLHEEILHMQGRRYRGQKCYGDAVIDEVLRRSLEGENPQDIAREMGMKPHAIWKIRTRLREEGFNIKVITKTAPRLTPIDWSKHPRFEDVAFKVR